MATCNINSLLADAGCFSCLSRGLFLPLKLVLLSQILAAKGGTVPDVATLLQRGACFSCLSAGEVRIIKLQLLCNIFGGNVNYVGGNTSQNVIAADNVIIT